MHVHDDLSNITLNRLAGTRIVADPDALDTCRRVPDIIVLRLAPDEVFVTPPLPKQQLETILAADPHAIVIAEGAFSGAWVREDRARMLLERLAEWEMPPRSEQPTFAQGAVGGIATKLYFAGGRVLFLVQAPYAQELEERLA